MKKYTVFYRIGSAIKSVRVSAQSPKIAASYVYVMFHGAIVAVEG